MINVCYKDGIYSWETNGDESISDWVQRNLYKGDSKPKEPNMDQLIFRTSDDRLINLGWNTSILNKGDMYKCEFRPKMAHKMKSEQSRTDFPDFIDFSNVKSFNVKNKGCSVSQLYRNKGIEFLQVNFLPEESLYQALYRDGRFVKDKLRNYDLEILKEKCISVMLFELADDFADHDFKFKKKIDHDFKFKKRRNANATLPSKVMPYKDERGGKPAYRVQAGTSEVIVKDETSEEHEESSCGTMITSDQELLDFISESMLESKIDPKSEKKRIEKIDELFETSFNNYALKEKYHLYASDYQFIVDVCNSVGAVVLKYTSKAEDFKGTCFRIGTQFVLTNMHVVDLINEKSRLLENVFIDFDHGETTKTNGVFCCDRDQYSAEGKFVPVLSSTELDYAVLKLVPIVVPIVVPFPPSLTGMFDLQKFYQHLQEGTFLTFVGHQNGCKTATNLLCPIRNPENLDEKVVMLLSQRDKEWLNDKKVETYESTFLNGASGSPGFLLRERRLAVMHTRGVCLDRSSRKCVEQGIMISAIMSDVWYKIKSGLLPLYEFQDLFDIERP